MWILHRENLPNVDLNFAAITGDYFSWRLWHLVAENREEEQPQGGADGDEWKLIAPVSLPLSTKTLHTLDGPIHANRLETGEQDPFFCKFAFRALKIAIGGFQRGVFVRGGDLNKWGGCAHRLQ